MTQVSVVYLARMASGMSSFRTFVESYRRHPAGIEHHLVVAYKGFHGRLGQHRLMLDGLTHGEVELPDSGFDVGSYREVSWRLGSTHVCFLNSYSEILAPQWLRVLFEHAVRPNVGVVGATGSWESLYTNCVFGNPPARARFLFHGRARKLWQWGRLVRCRADFPPAPNPHMRTNAFLIERARWLSLKTGYLRSKHDLYRFESGRKSMTRQLMSQGLDVLVVGRDGIAYSKDQWPTSSTFRSGDQSNLLVADNRTRQYEAAVDREKMRLALLAWGIDDELDQHKE
jgi:hypothetical protein